MTEAKQEWFFELSTENFFFNFVENKSNVYASYRKAFIILNSSTQILKDSSSLQNFYQSLQTFKSNLDHNFTVPLV